MAKSYSLCDIGYMALSSAMMNEFYKTSVNQILRMTERMQ